MEAGFIFVAERGLVGGKKLGKQNPGENTNHDNHAPPKEQFRYRRLSSAWCDGESAWFTRNDQVFVSPIVIWAVAGNGGVLFSSTRWRD